MTTFYAPHVLLSSLCDLHCSVQNTSRVATDLQSVERVTGRLTRAKLAAALSGLWIGLFVGVAYSLSSSNPQLAFLVTTPLLGPAFMLVWSQIAFTATARGDTREFVSASQIVATKYKLLIKHRSIRQALELPSTLPAARS